MMRSERKIYYRLAAIWLAGATLLGSVAAAHAEAPLKPMTREEVMLEAKKQQEQAARAAKKQQEEAVWAAKKMSDWWHRRDSVLPDSALKQDRPAQDPTITDTQRQQFRPQVLSAPEAETKPAKPKIPKAGKSQLPGSYASEMDPNGSKSDRQFNRKKKPSTWPRPRNW